MATETNDRAIVHIRWLIRRDLPDVLDIDSRSFFDVWEEEDFVRFMRQRNAIGMVAEFGERIVGFMVYELQKNRLDLIRMAVHPHWRKLDIGTQMVDKLVSKLSTHRRDRIRADVPDDMYMAHAFLKRMGFEAHAIQRGEVYRFEYQIAGAGPVEGDEVVNRIKQFEVE